MSPTFRTLEEYHGQSVDMPGVTMDPYRDLDAPSGCNDSDPRIKKIADEARGTQERLKSITLVAPGDYHDHGFSQLHTAAMENMVPRVGEDPFFVMGERGRDVGITSRHRLRLGIIQDSGSCLEEATGMLHEYRKTLAGLDDLQLAVHEALLDLPRGGLLVDSGAGADYNRIRRLERYARERGGRLMAHDVVPEAARAGHREVPETPYLAIPGRSEFLGKLLAEHTGPTVMALQNVVSILAYTDIMEIVRLLSAGDIQKLVISQSVYMSLQSNVIPCRYHPGEQGYNAYLIYKCIQKYGDRLMQMEDKDRTAVVGLVSLQTERTMLNILMELIRHRLIQESAKQGWGHERTLVVEQSRVLDPEEAREHIKDWEGYVESFLAGEFNSVTLGCFGTQFQTDSDVHSGHLRIRSQRFNTEISRHPLHTPEIRPQEGQNIQPCKKKIITPVQTRFCGLADSRRTIEQKIGLPKDRWDKIANTIPLEELLEWGARLGHEMVFDVFGKQVRIDLVRPLLGRDEHRLKQAFVSGKDT